MSEIELGKSASEIWSDLKDKAGAVEYGRREVQDRNHATIQFSTGKYNHSYVEIDVRSDSPSPERNVALVGMGDQMQIVALGRYTKDDVKFSYTMTSTEGVVVTVSEGGIRSVSIHGIPKDFEELVIADENKHLIAFSKKFVRVQQNMPGSGMETPWDILCEEFRGL